MTLTFDLVTLTLVNFNFLSLVNMLVSVIDIQSLIHDIQSKQFFYKIAYLTLTFNLMTLTLGQLQNRVYIDHVLKYHQYLITRSWFIDKNSHGHKSL